MKVIYKIFEEQNEKPRMWFNSRKIFEADELEIAKAYCEALNFMSCTYFNAPKKYGVYEVSDTYENREIFHALMDGRKVY